MVNLYGHIVPNGARCRVPQSRGPHGWVLVRGVESLT